MDAQHDGTASPEALGGLLSRAGHDVRGPAGVVTGALDEIERALGAEAVSPNASFFTMARRSVRKLLRLADRYTVMSELQRQSELPAQALDLEPLVRAAVTEASFVYGRRSVDVALDFARLSGVGCGRWLTAAVTDAMMLGLRSARARVSARLEEQCGATRLVVESDGDADTLETAWAAALAGSDMSEENALPILVVTGVLKAHGGAARLEREGERVRLVLEWPSNPPRREGAA